ncbi:Bug family tripartite tricarboxylate transporter substrate binding protein [Candidatus Halocynthiibacter alkanivorans]|jgi:putative tricarboxylic transport membrane protein|uniref:Bug family tripartite tricarboxylate transporter substrate binding protein n=1 Tax=Candidatus Halocynthiibacter alkanivorans TaxID=2267619 RepID=UPI000DF14C1E|nr:tripartite tricarboxylate transporter substrate binding protein [Candidatus Halocynthiibacter alkanivorans]
MDKYNKPDRRTLLKGAAAFGGVAMSSSLAGAAFAQEDFPFQTMRVVTHAGAGGGTDITTRMMMLRARRVFKQDMTVVSKRGGSGSAALMYLNSQPRDGHTFLTITQSHIFQIIQKKIPITIDQLVGLARATDDPTVVAVPANSPINSLEDLIRASKEKSGGLKWGTTFAGGADHVGLHNFAKKAEGIEYTIVPFEGGGDIVTSLVGGNMDAAILNYAEGESQFLSGDLKPVVTLAGERIGSIPDVMTAMEQGIDAKVSTVRGFAVLSGIKEDRMESLEQGLLKAMQHPVYQAYLASGGMTGSSVVGMDGWNDHIDRIFVDSQTALKELGLL